MYVICISAPETPVIGAHGPTWAPLAARHVKLDCKAVAAAGSTSDVADAMSVIHQRENFQRHRRLDTSWLRARARVPAPRKRSPQRPTQLLPNGS